MLTRRISETFWVCSHEDPALLDAVDDEEMRTYLLARDIAKLPIDVERGVVKSTSEPVSLVQCKPLSTEHEYLLSAGVGDASARWEVFRKHVVGVRNLDQVSLDGGKLRDDDRAAIPMSFVSEVVSVIIEKASGRDGVNLPFSLPATWQGQRLRARSLRAIHASSITDV